MLPVDQIIAVNKLDRELKRAGGVGLREVATPNITHTNELRLKTHSQPATPKK